MPDCDYKCQRSRNNARSQEKSKALKNQNLILFILNKSPSYAFKKSKTFEKPIATLTRRVVVQPQIKPISIQNPNYLHYLLKFGGGRKAQNLCRHYKCQIKTCKNKCTNIDANGPVDFKIQDFVKIHDENTNLSPKYVYSLIAI